MDKPLQTVSFKTITNTRVQLEKKNDILYIICLKVISLSDYEEQKSFYEPIRTFSNCIYCFSMSAFCEETFAKIMMFKLCETIPDFDSLFKHDGTLQFGITKLNK